VWMMLQQRIDDVLEGVKLADLLDDEMVVRARVGLGPAARSSWPPPARSRAVRPRGSPGEPAAPNARRLPSCTADGRARAPLRRTRAGGAPGGDLRQAAFAEPPADDVRWLAAPGDGRRRGPRRVGAAVRPACRRPPPRAARRARRPHRVARRAGRSTPRWRPTPTWPPTWPTSPSGSSTSASPPTATRSTPGRASRAGVRLGRVLLVFGGSVRAARGAGLAEAAAVCDRYLAELGAPWPRRSARRRSRRPPALRAPAAGRR
jgi:hypothetical protein